MIHHINKLKMQIILDDFQRDPMPFYLLPPFMILGLIAFFCKKENFKTPCQIYAVWPKYYTLHTHAYLFGRIRSSS